MSKKPLQTFIGIDPGKTGSIAFYFPQIQLVKFIDWPKTGSERDLIDAIDDMIQKHNILVKSCVLEKVSAMPKQGVKSMFSFGCNFGAWRTIIAFYQWPVKFLTPQVWRKGLVLPTDGATPKIANYNVAVRLFPTFKIDLLGSKGAIKDGRVDALLMAYKAMYEIGLK